MKYYLKIITAIIIFLILCTAATGYILWYERECRYRYKENIADVYILFGDSITNLEKVELKVCDSIFTYKSYEIKDTLSDRLYISDKKYPCEVKFKYYFTDNSFHIIKTDSLNSIGCSGTNRYILYRNSVEYDYLP